MSRLGKLSQAAQRAKRLAAIAPEEVAEMTANPPPAAGDAIGSIELRNFRNGTVTRWTVLRGNRRNNYCLRTPDKRKSKPHGMAWIMTKLRPVFLHHI